MNSDLHTTISEMTVDEVVTKILEVINQLNLNRE